MSIDGAVTKAASSPNAITGAPNETIIADTAANPPIWKAVLSATISGLQEIIMSMIDAHRAETATPASTTDVLDIPVFAARPYAINVTRSAPKKAIRHFMAA